MGRADNGHGLTATPSGGQRLKTEPWPINVGPLLGIGLVIGHMMGHAMGHVTGHMTGHIMGYVMGHVMGHAMGHGTDHVTGHGTDHVTDMLSGPGVWTIRSDPDWPSQISENISLLSLDFCPLGGLSRSPSGSRTGCPSGIFAHYFCLKIKKI